MVNHDYVDITAEEFKEKMEGFENNLAKMFAESAALERRFRRI